MPVRIELRRDAGRIGPTTGPWIRRKQVARVQGLETAEALAEVVTRKGETLGWGLMSPQSSIAARILTYGEAPPADDWLQTRLASALAARTHQGYDRQDTTGYRVVNSEGDGLPGLVVDRYDDDFVLQITTAPMAVRRTAIEAWFRAQGHDRLHVVLPQSAAKHEGFEPGVYRQHDASTLHFREYGIAFETPAPPSQKTGAYFDQRENRRTVARLAAAHGGPLLDVGCHIGGFALHAARAGAQAVGVDSSSLALEHAARNASANGLCGLSWALDDMFGPLLGGQNAAELAGPFGTIVLDPPKVATNKNNVDKAVDAMRRLVGRVAPRLAEGGHLVLCSCSHHLGRDHLDRVMATSAGTWTRVAMLGAGPDHPVMPGHREGEYLRVGVYRR
ncbi:MAG: class I SAM-dependent rRNA methyltransferase [Nannocystaceae bacterium]|nr:class I SAM-dependent methyltransferase [bacterium]